MDLAGMLQFKKFISFETLQKEAKYCICLPWQLTGDNSQAKGAALPGKFLTPT